MHLDICILFHTIVYSHLCFACFYRPLRSWYETSRVTGTRWRASVRTANHTAPPAHLPPQTRTKMFSTAARKHASRYARTGTLIL